jgi:hypothetical protein
MLYAPPVSALPLWLRSSKAIGQKSRQCTITTTIARYFRCYAWFNRRLRLTLRLIDKAARSDTGLSLDTRYETRRECEVLHSPALELEVQGSDHGSLGMIAVSQGILPR